MCQVLVSPSPSAQLLVGTTYKNHETLEPLSPGPDIENPPVRLTQLTVQVPSLTAILIKKLYHNQQLAEKAYTNLRC